ncbi:hypothetical protein ACV1CZ_20085 [Aeromonas caviae]
MSALIELLFVIFIFPFFLFGILLRKIGKAITDHFEPVQLLTSIWLLSMSYFLWPYQEVNESVKFISIFDVLAQSKLLGFSTPHAFILLASGLFFSSMFFAWRKSK